ncbi:unnamed protein product [Cunninghamella echinulata]
MSIKGFFGLTITPGKVYSQIAENSFRLTMASIGEVSKNARTSLRIKVDEREFYLCSLTPGKLNQQLLNLIIVKGEEVALSVVGENTIHLTGNYLHEYDEEEDEDDEDYDSDELDSDEVDIPIEDEEEYDEDMDDEDILNGAPDGIDHAKILAYLNGDIDSDAMDSGSEEELDPSRIQEIEEEEEQKPAKNLSKKEQRKQKRAAEEQAEQEQAAKKSKVEQKKAKADDKKSKAEEKKPKAEEKKSKAEEKKPKAEEKKPAKQQEQKKVTKLPSGLVIEDVKVGDGQNVKSGARIGMRYIGKLTNGKVFDKNTSGKPFVFRLGAGEVIKGWDQGIVGMKLGGERKLTIPAALAYGKRGAPPQIPPNATLVFEIKLVSMK